MESIFLFRDGQQYGPYSSDEIKRFLTTGHAASDDLARSSDSRNWVTVETLLQEIPLADKPDGLCSQEHPNFYQSKPSYTWSRIALALSIVSLSGFLFFLAIPGVILAHIERVNGIRCTSNLTSLILGYLVLAVAALYFLGSTLPPQSSLSHRSVARQSDDDSGSPDSENLADRPFEKANLTKDEWKSRLAEKVPMFGSNGVMIPGMRKASFVEICGEPDRTETVNGAVYWYYACSDGDIQLQLDAFLIGKGVVTITQTNDY